MSFYRFGRQISSLHLELTAKCNLACPGCARTINPVGHVESLKKDLSWERLIEVIDPYELSELEHVYACGNVGDPLASAHVVEVFSNLKLLNPDTQHSIHTNGSLRTPKWWSEFPQALNKNHRVVFGIDGLEDTNHLYRKGAVWSKVMENTQAFIQAGGIAEWHFIIFEHNEHQVEEARALSQELGFSKFTTLNSTRPDDSGLGYKRPSNYVAPPTRVVCTAIEKQELFISAEGKIYPCCYLAVAGFATKPKYWETDYDNEGVVNRIPFKPNTTVCKDNCSRVNGKDIWGRQFEE